MKIQWGMGLSVVSCICSYTIIQDKYTTSPLFQYNVTNRNAIYTST